MRLIKFKIPSILILLCASCTTIPEKVPELIEASTHTMDSQNAIAVAEWESAIAAANASKKLLSLVHSYLSNVDTGALSATEKSSISNFVKGYPHVMKQLDNVIARKSEPQSFANNTKAISDAIRMANSYIAESIDENGRIEAVIQSIQSLKKDN